MHLEVIPVASPSLRIPRSLRHRVPLGASLAAFYVVPSVAFGLGFWLGSFFAYGM
jgi:hypothetical protein